MSNIGSLKPFQKGSDPRRNTKGRPVGSTTFRQLLIKAGMKEIDTKQGKMKIMTIMAHQLLDRAVKGDIRSIKLVLDLVEGPVKKQKRYIKPEPVGMSDEELERLKKLFSTPPKTLNPDSRPES